MSFKWRDAALAEDPSKVKPPNEKERAPNVRFARDTFKHWPQTGRIGKPDQGSYDCPPSIVLRNMVKPNLNEQC